MRIVNTYSTTFAVPRLDIARGRSLGQKATPADYAAAADLVAQGWTVAELAEVLFCTSLQPSEAPDHGTVLAAVTRSLRRCRNMLGEYAGEVAARYGDDPNTASRRMRWSRSAVVAAFFPPAPDLGLAS